MASDGETGAVGSLVAAIVEGDTREVGRLVAADPHLVNETLPGNPRSMLHHTTDWPGHRPNVAETIRLLVAAGADANVTMPHPTSPGVAETPLHWAASSNDVAALDALLDAGADVDSLGGIFGGCTPYEEAIIFEHYDAARRLLERGATNYLPGAAALGRSDEVETFFDADGRVRLDIGALPHWPEPPPAQELLDRALWFACRSGHLEIAKSLLERGADPGPLTPPGTSALDEATRNGHTEVVAWLGTLAT